MIAIDSKKRRKVARIPAGKYGVSAMCRNSKRNEVYIAGYGTVTVIDGSSSKTLRTITTPSRAGASLACSERSDKVYCATDAGVMVIDLRADTVVGKLEAFGFRGNLFYAPNSNRLVLASQGFGTDGAGWFGSLVVYDCSTDAAVHYVKANGELSLICMDESRDVLFYKHEGHVKLLNVRTDSVTELLNARGGWFCLAPKFNKLYCTDRGDSIITVVDVRRDSVVARVHLGTGASGSMLYIPSEALVYAGTNSGLAVIDCQYDSIVAAVPFEGGTSAICFSAVSREVYCADGRRCVVRAVSTKSHRVTALIQTSVALTTMCYDMKSDRLYCADAARDSVFSVDCETWRPHKAISVPGDALLSYYDPDNNKAYVTYVVGSGRRFGAVCVVNCDNDSLLGVIRGPIRPMTHSPKHDRLYCSGEDNAVWVVDGSGDSVISRIKLAHPAMSACYDSSGDVFYVAGNTSLSAIDCAADSIRSSAQIGNNLWAGIFYSPATNWDGIYYSPATKRVYCADFAAATVRVADAKTCSLMKSIPVGKGPSNLCGSSDGGKVYCANRDDSTVTVIDARGDSVLATLNVGNVPHEMCYAADSNLLYCASQGEGSVSVIDGKTDQLVRTVVVGAGPASLVWSPKHSCVYVLNTGSSSISVIR